METAARANGKTISEWLRGMVYELLPAYCPHCEQHVMANIAMDRDALVQALERDGNVLLTHAFPLAPDHKFPASDDTKRIVRKRVSNGLI